MKLKKRNLVVGMQGSDVRELQRDLVWLGFDILSQEMTSRRFGESTRASVQTIQKENKLKSDGLVDIKRLRQSVRGLASLGAWGFGTFKKK